MSIRRTTELLFGAGERWEYRLVAARIIVIAAVVAGMYLLITSDFKQYAAIAFWLFVVAVIGSVIYQFRRRWKELRRVLSPALKVFVLPPLSSKVDEPNRPPGQIGRRHEFAQGVEDLRELRQL